MIKDDVLYPTVISKQHATNQAQRKVTKYEAIAKYQLQNVAEMLLICDLMA